MPISKKKVSAKPIPVNEKPPRKTVAKAKVEPKKPVVTAVKKSPPATAVKMLDLRDWVAQVTKKGLNMASFMKLEEKKVYKVAIFDTNWTDMVFFGSKTYSQVKTSGKKVKAITALKPCIYNFERRTSPNGVPQVAFWNSKLDHRHITHPLEVLVDVEVRHNFVSWAVSVLNGDVSKKVKMWYPLGDHGEVASVVRSHNHSSSSRDWKSLPKTTKVGWRGPIVMLDELKGFPETVVLEY